jgi:hypothetical protein
VSDEGRAGEAEDAKAKRGVLRHELVQVSTDDYNHARLRALIDADTLAAEVGLAWVQAGPVGVPPDPGEGWWYGGLPLSGMVQDIWATGTDRYFATSQGGLWRAPVSGASWEALTDALPSLAVNTVTGVAGAGAVADLLVVGTGDAYHVYSEFAPWWGLYRSVDGGRTFHPLDGGPGVSRFFGQDVNEILMVDSARWLVATRTGLYWTIDGGRHFGKNLDVDDGEPLDRGNILDVRAIKAGLPLGIDARVTYAVSGVGLRRFDVPETGLPVRMQVGSETWERRVQTRSVPGKSADADHHAITVTAEPGDVAFDHRVINGQELLVMSVAALDQQPGVHNELVIASGALTGAGTWDALATDGITDSPTPAQTSYDHVVFLDPQWHTADARALLWVGTRDVLTGQIGAGGSFVPAGAKLREISKTKLHADQHLIVEDPRPGNPLGGANVTSVLVGNDGGVFLNDSGGVAPWVSLGSAPTGLFYDLAAETIGGQIVVAGGLQDNGSVLGSAPTAPFDPDSPLAWTWQGAAGGDGGASLLLPGAAPQDVVAFLVADDSLVRWVRTAATGAWTQDPPRVFDVAGAITNWGYLVEPAQGFSARLARALGAGGTWDTVYFAVARDGGDGALLYRCTGAAGALTPTGVTGSRPSFQRVAGAEWDSTITAMLGVPDTAPIVAWTGLWVGHKDGKLRYAANALSTATPPTWTDCTPLGNTRPIGAIAMDPLDFRVIAVTTTGFAQRPSRYKTGRVFLRAVDGSWTDISGRNDSDGTNLPDVPAYGVAILGTSPRRIVVGTEIGVFTTTDDGQTWKRLDLAMSVSGAVRSFQRLPRVPVYSVAALEASHAAAGPMPRIVVGTYGRSAWLLQDLSTVVGAAGTAPIAALHVELDGGFGFVHAGGSVTRPLVIENRGAAPADLQAIEVTGAVFSLGGGPPRAGDPPITLAPGARRAFTVTCAPPAAAAGVQTATLTVRTSIADQATRELALSADAVADAVGRLAVLPTRPIDFGELVPHASSRAAWLRLRNVGTGPLVLTTSIDGVDWDAARPSRGGLELLDAPTAPLAAGEEHVCRVRLHLPAAEWPRLEATVVIRPDVGPEQRVIVRGGQGVPTWFVVLGVILGVGAAAAITAVIVHEATKN